jgi:hypothetical protein
MSVHHPNPEPGGGLLAQARDKLRQKPRPDRHWAALGAAAFFALCALVFVMAAVLAPPLSYDPAAKVGVK